ncbi:hypothetical protein LDFHOB_01530 [Candidatus Electronema aureum]
MLPQLTFLTTRQKLHLQVEFTFHKNGVWLAGIRPLKTETKSEVNFFNIILFLMVNSMYFLGSRPLCHSWFTITG